VSIADEMAEQKKLEQRLIKEPGFVGAVLRGRARREKKHILLFVDQFEELYTLVPDPVERTAFTASLAAVADDPTSPIRLVISIRSDFLDRVPEDPRFMAELSQGLVFLNSPGTEGLREAIVSPAELAGYRFESTAIVDDMIKHLATTSGALPCSSSRPASCGTRATRPTRCSPSRPTTRSAASPARWPATPTR